MDPEDEIVRALQRLLASETSDRGKALRLVEIGAAATLRDAWALLVSIGEVTEADVPDRYRSDPQ